MSEETLKESPLWEKQRWWGLWWLHLPPAGYIILAALLGGTLGAWAVRHISGVVDISLRLEWVVRSLGLFTILIAFFSGWRAAGPWWARWFSRLLVASSVGVGVALIVLGESASTVLVDLGLGLFFASVPLHFRRAKLTEPWMRGSLRPALLALTASLAFLPVLAGAQVYQYFWSSRAQSSLEDIKTLTNGLTRLAERGSLPKEEVASLTALANDLPRASSLWLSLAVLPPKEAKRRQGELEEATLALLGATQSLFTSARVVSVSQGPWDITGSVQDPNNQKHFAKAKIYWEQVRQIVGEGQLLEPFIEDTAAPYGLDPNGKLRPSPDDTVGRVALFRAEVSSQLEGFKGALSGFDGDLTRFAEASAARITMASYEELPNFVPVGISATLDPNQVEAWSRLRLGGAELFDLWGLLDLSDPESRLIDEARCLKDKPRSDKSGKKLVAYLCPAYDLSQPDAAKAFVARVVVFYRVDQSATADSLWIEARRPKNLADWKREVISALKRRGFLVNKRSDGFEISASEKDSGKATLLLQFDDNNKELARMKIERLAANPTKK